MDSTIPSGLKAEEIAAWSGWRTLGDREVVREAASKGLHIELAHKFLAKRKNWDLSETERWFQAEVRAWALQLLMLHQVFKASHILTNIKLDPFDIFLETILDTKDAKLRDFIGEHLVQKNQLSKEHHDHWLLLKLFEKCDISTFQFKATLDKIMTLKDILSHDLQWKAKLAAFLFFNTFDFSILEFLQPLEAWRHLIFINETKLLSAWIHVYFSSGTKPFPQTSSISAEINRKLHNIFSNWEISTDMIEEVKHLQAYELTKEHIIYNQISCYGIFVNSDHQLLPNVLARFAKMENISNIESILNSNKSSVSHDNFLKMLTQFCLKNNLVEVLFTYLKIHKISNEMREELDSRDLETWLSIQEMLTTRDNKSIQKCILQTSKFLSDDNSNLHDYFVQNVYEFLALVLFDESINLQKILTDQQDCTIMNTTFKSEIIKNLLIKIPLIENILMKQNSDVFKPDITMYQLLTNYQQLDMSQIFYFRLRSLKSNEDLLPHFSSNHLNQVFGHREKLTFTYYLKLGRPSIASKLFFIENLKKYGKVTMKTKYIAANLAYSIAISNFEDTEITSACIAFTELIGINSDILRLQINVSNVIANGRCNSEEVRILFQSFLENKYEILKMLEETLLSSTIELGINIENLSRILTDWEIAFKFANFFKIDYPDMFLHYCLQNNLWLIFIIYTQYHQFPLDQILNLVPKFQNEILSEHISHALAFNLKLPDNDQKKKKDSKKNYTRPGKSGESPGLGLSSNSSGDSLNKIGMSHVYYVQNLDLIQVLCHCHKQENVTEALLTATKNYQNPTFAVFAVCYKPDATLISWLYWLCASVDLVNLYPTLNNYKVESDAISAIIDTIIKNNCITLLAESFHIFLPENPLCSLVTFLSEHSKNPYDSDGVKFLRLFKTVMNYMKFSEVITENEDTSELNYLTNQPWISEMGVRIVKFTLAYGFKSKFQQYNFLQLLCSEDFTSSLYTECPNLEHLKQLLVTISDVNVTMDMAAILELPGCSNSRQDELNRCVSQLVQLKHFDIALKLCQIEDLSVDNVIIEKWKSEFSTRNNFQDFWKRCDKDLRSSKVYSKLSSQFFIEIVDKIDDKLEKYIVLKIGFDWIKQCDVDDTDIQNIELEMWWLYLSINDWNNMEIEFGEEPYLKNTSTEIRRQARASSLKVVRNIKRDDMKRNFEDLIGKLLDKGQVVQAIRLEHMFNYQTDFLSLLLTCMKLAEGELSPYSLSLKHRLLMEGIVGRRRKRTLGSARLSVGNSSNASSGEPNSSKEMLELATNTTDAQAVLEALVLQVTKGSCIARRILCCSKISQATSRLYPRILTNYDASALLKITLTGDFDKKLEMAHDIMFAHNWNKHQICEFLCAELVSALSKHVLKESTDIETICLWGYPLDTTIHVVLDLCPDRSLMGSTLLVHANAPLSSTSLNALKLAVELLIRAHDCFTADCNMEGISKVLVRTRTLVTNLGNALAWGSLIRILTGLGRYAEMDYVFEILQENEQFEWLLGQGTARLVGLRRATMDYLRRRCPGRRELSRLVALRWGLYDSAADLWESEASETLSNLLIVAKLEMQNMGCPAGPYGLLELNGTDVGTKRCLENAMSCLTHAVQHHLLADRFKSANQAAQRAERIALQIGLLSLAGPGGKAVCVLDLTNDQFNWLVTKDLDFDQAFILKSSYDYLCDWAAALYNNCVVKGNHERYLPAFLSHIALTDVLAKDVVRKYLLDKTLSISQTTPAGIRAILEAIKSQTTKYRLASELGLKDVIHSLLEGQSKYFLKDTVWKTGCPAPNS